VEDAINKSGKIGKIKMLIFDMIMPEKSGKKANKYV